MDKPVRKAVRCYLIKNDKIVVTKYNEPNKKAGYYEIPGGKIEAGELPEQTAIREMQEETGIIVKKLKNKGNLIIEYPDRKFEFVVFLANTYQGEPKQFEDNTSEWLDINELLKKEKILASIQLLQKEYINGLVNENYTFSMYIKVTEQENILDINYKEEERFKPSKSEENGINLITANDLNILSIGISTAGSAEIKMAEKNRNSHIIATTIDKEGLNYTKNIIEQYGLSERIETKLEDISEKMPYNDEFFDFVYARLVLHYLDNENLTNALKEIKRVMKKHGRLYIVVRSRDEWEAKLEGASYDENTGITKYPKYDTLGTDNVEYLYRRLHTVDSLSSFLVAEGFDIKYIKEYKEQSYKDYKRTEKVKYPNSLIECLCEKP
ncbi:MAG: NUDIX domain-containing protein [Clostridia bacterium]|jgi:8-oxo-dGTP diphosphatase|uniref:NUDIX domain-containing protein n=1 Tax=Candidatus Merdicola sp. TaxID=3085652 RepID=UPI002F9CF06D